MSKKLKKSTGESKSDLKHFVMLRGMKFRAYDLQQKEVIGHESLLEFSLGEILSDMGRYPVVESTGLKYQDGEKNYAGDIFTFNYMVDLTKNIKLVGMFYYNPDELRYEIEIFNNPDYAVLSYLGNGVMYNFNKVGNIYENPGLLEE